MCLLQLNQLSTLIHIEQGQQHVSRHFLHVRWVWLAEQHLCPHPKVANYLKVPFIPHVVSNVRFLRGFMY